MLYTLFREGEKIGRIIAHGIRGQRYHVELRAAASTFAAISGTPATGRKMKRDN
jgi:hypothetical protein